MTVATLRCYPKEASTPCHATPAKWRAHTRIGYSPTASLYAGWEKAPMLPTKGQGNPVRLAATSSGAFPGGEPRARPPQPRTHAGTTSNDWEAHCTAGHSCSWSASSLAPPGKLPKMTTEDNMEVYLRTFKCTAHPVASETTISDYTILQAEILSCYGFSPSCATAAFHCWVSVWAQVDKLLQTAHCLLQPEVLTAKEIFQHQVVDHLVRGLPPEEQRAVRMAAPSTPWELIVALKTTLSMQNWRRTTTTEHLWPEVRFWPVPWLENTEICQSTQYVSMPSEPEWPRLTEPSLNQIGQLLKSIHGLEYMLVGPGRRTYHPNFRWLTLWKIQLRPKLLPPPGIMERFPKRLPNVCSVDETWYNQTFAS